MQSKRKYKGMNNSSAYPVGDVYLFPMMVESFDFGGELKS